MNIRTLSGQNVVYNLANVEGYEANQTYALIGPDASLFEITEAGLIRFKETPDVLSARDSDLDNIYSFSVVSEGGAQLITLDAKVVDRVTELDPTLVEGDTNLQAIIHTDGFDHIWGDGDTSADAGPLVITWSYDRGPALTDLEVDIFQEIFSAWTHVANVEFIFIDSDDGDGESAISLGFKGVLGLGQATMPSLSGQATIDINFAIRADFFDASNTLAKGTLLHEIGHAVFGLADPAASAGLNGELLPWELNSEAYTVMSYLKVIASDYVQDAVTPMGLDILAAQALYGANSGANSGDDTYLMEGRATSSIYDTGGRDTLDFSLQKDGLDLDMRDGTVSEYGQGSFLAIASGTVIEDVIGSAHNDVIALNDAANTVQAGAGDDIISRVGADDTVDGGDGFDVAYVDAAWDEDLLANYTNIELVYFTDKAINLSAENPATALSNESTTYISMDSSQFDFTLWGVSQGDSLGQVAAAAPAPNETSGLPTITGAAGLSVTSWGGLFAQDLVEGGEMTVSSAGMPDQTVFTSNQHDNTYVINMSEADQIIHIYDYSGDDTLVLDGFNGWRVVDSYIEHGDTILTFKNNGLGREVEITIHASQSYGHIENLILRNKDGSEEAFIIAPNQQALDVGFFRSATGLDTEFPFIPVSYLVPGRSDDFWAAEHRTLDNFLNTDENLFVFSGGDNLIFGGPGEDFIRDGSGQDSIYGGAGDDYIWQGPGNDYIDMGAGDDIVLPFAFLVEDGDDIIYGRGGNDYIDSGSGNDLIFAGSGNDFVMGVSGNDTVFGGGGNDTIFGGGEIGDTPDKAYNDVLGGGAGDDFVASYSGDNLLFGGSGNDTLNDGEGDSVIWAGTGDDQVWVWGGDNIIGLRDGNDLAGGHDGDDTIYGAAGDDSIDGNGGNDLIFGGKGDDVLFAGEGDDTLYGGAGSDSFLIKQAAGHTEIWGFDVTADTLDVYAWQGDALDFSLIVNTAVEENGGLLLTFSAQSTVWLDGLTTADINSDWLL